jgi:hypothetical protein
MKREYLKKLHKRDRKRNYSYNGYCKWAYIRGYVGEIDDIDCIPIKYDKKKKVVSITFGEWVYEIPLKEFREKLKLLGIRI